MKPSAHPDPSALLAFHERRGRGADVSLAAHIENCPECREARADFDWIERALADWPDATPPADGLDRLLERIQEMPPRPEPVGWLVPALESLLGVVLGAALIYDTARRIVELPLVAALPLADPLRVLSAWALAIVGFFAVGSLVTLAIAPALFFDSESQQAAPGTAR